MLYDLALLLPSMVCLFWAVLLLCNIRNNHKSQNILAIGMLMTCFTFLNLAYFIDGVNDYETYYILDILDPAFFIPPVMYLYFKSVTGEDRFGWKDYIWFLPFVVIEITLFSLYMAMGEANAIRYSQDLLTYGTLLPEYTDLPYKLHYIIGAKIYNIIGLISSTAVSIYAVISTIRYHHRLRDFYSYLEDKSMTQNNGVLIWFIIATVNAILLFYLRRSFFIHDHHTADIFIFAALAVNSFLMGFYGYHIKYTAQNLATDLEQADQKSEAEISEIAEDAPEEQEDEKRGRYEHLAKKFNKLIDEDKIFLKNSLRADEVAAMIHSNRTYISRMIHEEFHSNFSDYINQQRIKYSKELMLLNPGMKINEIAEKSGFINASSFSRTFKQFTGKPPREWLKDTYYGIIS